MPFTFKMLPLEGVVEITPRVFSDPRGFFMEAYKKSDFTAEGIKEDFNQDNRSFSTKNVLRGLHYQRSPMAQGKLVSCVKGAILDVAVNITKGSPDFGRWASVELNDENNKMLYIPEGFAHGFLTLSDEALVSYKCTNEYSVEDDGGIIWNDPDIDIDWGIDSPLLSDKDALNPSLQEAKL